MHIHFKSVTQLDTSNQSSITVFNLLINFYTDQILSGVCVGWGCRSVCVCVWEGVL